MGDELNVIPETFKAAAEAQNAQIVRGTVPLQPPDRIEGCFTAAERGPGGWYEQFNDSMGSLAAGAILSSPRRNAHQSRDSLDSTLSTQTNTSIFMPRRVESIMGEEDRKKYAMAQANQRAAGGAYMTGPPHGQVYEMTDPELRTGGLESYSDRPIHRRAASYNSAPSGNVSPEATSPLEAPLTGGYLTIPQASAPGGRNGRNISSPLSRLSLIRTPSNDGEDIELQGQQRPRSLNEPSRSYDNRRRSS
jgi:chitin synthase